MKRRTRNAKANVVNARRLTRRDPARLGTFVNGFTSQLRQQFAKLRGSIIAEFTKGSFSTNAFCATGPGGGVDPSCSPGGAGVHDVKVSDLIHTPISDVIKDVAQRVGAAKGAISKAITSYIDRVPGGKFLRAKAKALNDKLAERYGPATMGRIVKAANILSWGATGTGIALGMPIVVPASGLMLAGVVLAEAHLQISRRLRTSRPAPATNADVDIQAEAAKLLRQLHRAISEWMRENGVHNAFCPTGDGGGHDNSCSPRKLTVKEKKEVRKLIDKHGWNSPEVDAYMGRLGAASSSSPQERAPAPVATPAARPSVGASIEKHVAASDPHLGVDFRDLHGRLEAEHGALPIADMHRELLRLRDEGKIELKHVTHHMSGILHSKYVIGTGYKNNHGEWSDELGYAHPVRNAAPSWGAPLPSSPQERGGRPVANWTARSDPNRLQEFQQWLLGQFSDTLTGRTQEQQWQQYIMRGWQQGVGRTFDDVTRARPRTSPEEDIAHQGSRAQFLHDAFNNPPARERVDLIASRTFDEMEDVTRDMANRMGHVLTDGMISGASPRDIASDLIEATEFGRARAEKVARFEIMRAHSEGQLDAFEQLGVNELGVMAEVLPTDDDRTCEDCASLEGKTYTVEEARGMLPLHPGCRCAWIPNTEGA